MCTECFVIFEKAKNQPLGGQRIKIQSISKKFYDTYCKENVINILIT